MPGSWFQLWCKSAPNSGRCAELQVAATLPSAIAPRRRRCSGTDAGRSGRRRVRSAQAEMLRIRSHRPSSSLGPLRRRCAVGRQYGGHQECVRSVPAEMLRTTAAGADTVTSLLRVAGDAPSRTPPSRSSTGSAPRMRRCPEARQRPATQVLSARRMQRCSGPARRRRRDRGARSADAEMIRRERCGLGGAVRVHSARAEMRFICPPPSRTA